jgi:hypothetical protein
VAGALSAAIIIAIITGCMSLQIGGRTTHQVTSESIGEDGVFVEKGVAHVKGNGDLDVYYPVPYQHPPNVELVDGGERCDIVEQKEDHFRIRNPHGGKVDVQWKARGMRVASSHTAPAVPTAAVPPPDPPPSSASAAPPPSPAHGN